MNTTVKSRYITTQEASTLLGTYPAWLWTQVGKTLTPPVRKSPKKVFWLRIEIERLAAERDAINKILQS